MKKKKINCGMFTITYHKQLKEEKKIVSWLKKIVKKEKMNLVFCEEIDGTEEILEEKIKSKTDIVNIIFIFVKKEISEDIEKIEPLLTQKIESVQHIFSTVAFDLIDSEALFLRSLAGKINDTFIFCFPSNYKVFKFFAKAILFPELQNI